MFDVYKTCIKENRNKYVVEMSPNNYVFVNAWNNEFWVENKEGCYVENQMNCRPECMGFLCFVTNGEVIFMSSDTGAHGEVLVGNIIS